MPSISSVFIRFHTARLLLLVACLVPINCRTGVHAAPPRPTAEKNRLETREFTLAAGETLRLEQRGRDGALILEGKGYRLRVDHELWNSVPEVLWFRAPVAGIYQVSVVAVGDLVGAEPFHLEHTRYPASDEKAAAIADTFLRWRQWAHGGSTDVPSPETPPPGDLGTALASLADRMAECDAAVLGGRIRLDAAKAYGRRQAWPEQAQAFVRAIRCFLDEQNLPWAMHAARVAALSQRDRGAFEAAVAHAELAVEIGLFHGRSRGLGISYNTLGRVYVRMGRFEDAIEAYQKAIEHYQSQETAENRAASRLNLGLALVQVGRWRLAEAHLQQVFNFWQQRGRPLRAGKAMLELGWLAHLQGDYPAALSWYEKTELVLPQHSVAGAGLLDRWASTLTQLGRYEEAEAKYLRALSAFEAADDLTNCAHVLINLADLLRRTGRLDEAAAHVDHGLRIFDSQQAVIETANGLRIKGKIHDARHESAEADHAMSRGLERLNAVLATTDNHFIARSFSHVYHEVLTDLADLKMRRHGQDSDAGHSHEAFLLLEQQRAWTLRRQIVRRGGGMSPTPWPHYEHLVDPSLPTPSGADKAALAEHFDRLFAHYQQGQQRRGSPVTLKAYSFADLQGFLAADQAALVFSLHQEHGYLWEVTRDGFRVHRLPDAASIQAMIAPFYNLTSQLALPYKRLQRQSLAAEIATMLLGRSTLAKDKPRWLIVPDGPLNLLPWAALPDPSHVGETLVSHHDLSFLPSLSTGLDLYHRQEHRPRPERTLLAFGDAAYGVGDAQPDPEVEPFAVRADSAPGIRADFSKNLPYSGAEVRTIAGLLPASRTTLITGSAVHAEALQNLGMLDYQLIHFATHGFHHPQFGDLSSLVLSTVDEAGKSRNGLIQAVDIQGWQLRAELVTLSACHTGLGESFRGEGVWGLGQAMMIAGASRVVTSLWAVRDETTKDLMVAFYQNLLECGLAPSQALRAAQVQLARRAETADPYFWAGFVLQGLSQPLHRPD